MQRGDKIKIAKFTGLSDSLICRYFKGEKVKFRNHLKIQNAIRRLEIELEAAINIWKKDFVNMIAYYKSNTGAYFVGATATC